VARRLRNVSRSNCSLLSASGTDCFAMRLKSQSDGKSLIHLMIGRCISEWASLEETLFDIFCTVLGADSALSAIVFYKTPTLDSRVTLTTELIEARFPTLPGEHHHQFLKEWYAIRGEIADQIVYRNLMAHHPVDDAGDGNYKIAQIQSESDIGFYFRKPKAYKVETSKSEQLRKPLNVGWEYGLLP
jgi:hypothetical protein